MRIAHVTDFYVPRLGGIEMHVHDLATRQRAAGHEVDVITATPRSPAERRTLVHPEEGAPRVRRVTEHAMFPAPFNPAGLRAGRRAVREGDYDVVHAHAGLVSPLAVAVAALASEVPTVVTVHSLLSWLTPAFRLADTGFDWSSWPAVWTAVSDVAAEPVRRLVAPAPVYALPNGIDAAQWRVEPLPRETDEILVVAVMRLVPRKRPIQLLRILRRARNALGPSRPMRAVIVGEGAERGSMERYVHRHGMTGWVDLPGRLERPAIRELFARADMFVAPAILESFGIAALEARCAGLPVVARTEGGIGEFVGDGEEGLLASSDRGMADAIVRLATDSGLREAIATRNRTVASPVAWPDVLRRTEEIYDLAIGSPKAVRTRDVFGMVS
jgi:glycosyltransferase involved in cell wall biosynthesis